MAKDSAGTGKLVQCVPRYLCMKISFGIPTTFFDCSNCQETLKVTNLELFHSKNTMTQELSTVKKLLKAYFTEVGKQRNTPF